MLRPTWPPACWFPTTADPPAQAKPENVRIFESAAAFRAWLEENHGTTDNQWVGYPRKGTGHATMTHAEAVTEALCFGWIDGQAGKTEDDVSLCAFRSAELDRYGARSMLAA